MFNIAYVSEPTADFDEGQLGELVAKSREWNANQAITGLLFFDGRFFVQFLEGDEDAVTSLFAKIMRDSRHRVSAVHRRSATGKLFPAWDMQLFNPTITEWPHVVSIEKLLADEAFVQAITRGERCPSRMWAAIDQIANPSNKDHPSANG